MLSSSVCLILVLSLTFPVIVSKLLQVKSSGMPILVYANKGDLPGSVSPQECADELGLTGLNNEQTPWHIE